MLDAGGQQQPTAGSTTEMGEVDYRRHSGGTWKSIPNYRSVFYTLPPRGYFLPAASKLELSFRAASVSSRGITGPTGSRS